MLLSDKVMDSKVVNFKNLVNEFGKNKKPNHEPLDVSQ
jgi:hypothetical protein